jgi:Tol biopolymer transport system component
MRRQGMGIGCGAAEPAARALMRVVVTAASVSGLLIALAAGAAPAQQCSVGLTTERVSVSSDDQQGNDRSVLPAVSADGCIVGFKSYATNLVANDRNGKVDVFTRDRVAHTTQRIPLHPATGPEPNDNSFPPALSHDGSSLVFASLSTNLVLSDFNMSPDVFLYGSDRVMATPLTIVFDQNGQGIGGGGAPDLPASVSAAGSFIAYSSSAGDLVPNDHNEVSDVFVYVNSPDAPVTELISVATVGALAGQSANGLSAGGAISADGCVVAFYSEATNLIAGDTNGVRDVYARNRCTGSTELVSVSSSGELANGPSQASGFLPSVSSDGQFVVFSSDASNLDPTDDNGQTDVFVRDRAAGTTRLLSKNASGQAGNGASLYGSISADGRFVAFQSDASNLVDGDTNGRTDVFAVDLESGEIRRISVTSSGGEANGGSTAPQISADGITVVFQSTATNLVPDDSNRVEDIFASVNELSFTATPTDTPTFTVTPTPTPTLTVTKTPTGPTPTPTVGDFCNSMCQAGQTCRRQVGGVVLNGVCLPDQNCVCFVEGTPSATPTRTGGTPTVTPTPTGPTPMPTGATATPTGPTRTPTGATATPTPTTAAKKKKGGGGCNCWIDPATDSASSIPVSTLLLPAALALRRRRWRRP